MTRRVLRAEELPPGSMRLVAQGPRGVGLFNVGGRIYALGNVCPHAGGPLCLGEVTGTTTAERPYELTWVRAGEIVRCPWHSWEVEIATGRTVTDPPRRAPTYPVWVEDGWIVLQTGEEARR